MSAVARAEPILQRVAPRRAPISIYEVHAASWAHDRHGRSLAWGALADRLIPYVADLGFTHIELMPVADEAGLAGFVESAHRAGIGVLLGWDAGGAAFDLGRPEVQQRLVADALRWTGEYGIDGLKVEAVAALLYRDYGRQAEARPPGEQQRWDAVEFLRTFNRSIHAGCPDCLTIAEESTAWPGITNPAQDGGLAFDFKSNLCWRYDVLRYFGRDPATRRDHHRDITAGMTYAYAEDFILPLGHGEASGTKGALIARMAGDDWQKFANLRALYGLMWGHPGKKLLFMGQEFAQRRGWDAASALDWGLRGNHAHDGVFALVRDLNRLYRAKPALHARDCEIDGFAWLVDDDAEHSVFAWLRHAPGAPSIAVVANLMPVARAPYRLPLPIDGRWREILNTDATVYGGTNLGNGAIVASDGAAWITLPPLATIMLEGAC